LDLLDLLEEVLLALEVLLINSELRFLLYCTLLYDLLIAILIYLS